MVVTEKAAQKILHLAAVKQVPPILRVGVRGGGCSGLSYFYDFTPAQAEHDHVWQNHGLTVVCDPKSFRFLADTELDYDAHMLKGGFRWRNPQAQTSCSCGESFTPKASR